MREIYILYSHQHPPVFLLRWSTSHLGGTGFHPIATTKGQGTPTSSPTVGCLPGLVAPHPPGPETWWTEPGHLGKGYPASQKKVENPKVMTFQDGLVSYEIQLEFEVFFFNIVKSYEVDPLFHALSHW